MIEYITGDIFESEAIALVNTVNLQGIMGKGIALQFKNRYHNNFKQYKKACKDGTIAIGKLFVCEESTLQGRKIIINFPTKNEWRKSSEYSYIESGLLDLVNIIKKYDISSIALPPLGAGNGGLQWECVKPMIEKYLGSLDTQIYVYEPTSYIVEHLKKERVKLTDARALLLYMLFTLVSQGEDVSEFSCEKICYFLQRFGAQDLFKLKYKPYYYGPYSGKVRYVLQYLNGSYIMGYSDMNKKAFETLTLIPGTYPEIKEYIESKPELLNIANNTHKFLDGYYSDFGLELLSSVDFLLCENPNRTIDEIHQAIKMWNHRKSVLFMERKYIEIAFNHNKSFF